jgi:hypothetical protein
MNESDFMAEEPIVAIALLTQTNLNMLKGSLKLVFPVPQDDRFEAMLRALDEASPPDLVGAR